MTPLSPPCVWGTSGQTGNLVEFPTSSGTAAWAVTPAGTATTAGVMRTGTRGTVSTPSHTYSSTPTPACGPRASTPSVWSLAVSKVLRAGSTRPALTYSRIGESTVEAQTRATLVALKLVTHSTTA